MVVPPDDEWNFAYVLPKESPDEPTRLVIPSSLQMGWCDSPAFFCAASETARDVADDFAAAPVGSLPRTPWRACCFAHRIGQRHNWKHMPTTSCDLWRCTSTISFNSHKRPILRSSNICHELSCTAFILFSRLLQSRGMMGKTQSPSRSSAQGDGLWATRKELLGWIFDGARRCIELPLEKITKLTAEIHSVTGRTLSRANSLRSYAAGYDTPASAYRQGKA